MEIVRTRAGLREWHDRQSGGSLGFVPTMGNLHAGHLALVDAAQAENDRVAVSIFVNPTQFGPNEDFDRYPRTFEADAALLKERGCDLLLFPETAAIYPEGADTFVVPGPIADPLCGAFRPGHFRGVATVVAILFHLVQPTRAYFGQKDWQQCMVLRRLVLDLAWPLEMVIVPTMREADGLAQSSRNQYLQGDERRKAATIHAALQIAHTAYVQGEARPDVLRSLIVETLAQEPDLRLQYAEVVDAETLRPIDFIHERPAVAAIAAYMGHTRLIDNLPLGNVTPLLRTR